MAKKSSVENNNKRQRLVKQCAAKRARLKEIIMDQTTSDEDRLAASWKLAEMPRNSSATRYRLRCEITGRPRANYRKFKLCRVMLRELASSGQIPGMVKSSW